jgi:predicted anti-sigma-YlaC factor YlaD
MDTPHSLTCKDFIDVLDDYVEGRLPLSVTVVMDTHLSLCPSCHQYLAGYRQTVGLAKAVMEKPVAIPDELRAIIERTVRDAMRDN